MGTLPYLTLQIAPSDAYKRNLRYEINANLATNRTATCSALRAGLTIRPLVVDADGAATAFSVAMDGHGRIALPAPLKTHAEIISEVVIIGANNYLELWNKIRWEEEKAMGQEQAWLLLEGLENRP